MGKKQQTGTIDGKPYIYIYRNSDDLYAWGSSCTFLGSITGVWHGIRRSFSDSVWIHWDGYESVVRILCEHSGTIMGILRAENL